MDYLQNGKNLGGISAGTNLNVSSDGKKITFLSLSLPSGVYQLKVRNVATDTQIKESNSLKFTILPKAPVQSITVLSPKGGEMWAGSPVVTGTISGSEMYKQDISWTGTPDDYNIVSAYLENLVNEQYVTVGRIPPFGIGSIAWVVGVVSKTNCDFIGPSNLPNNCFNKANMKVIPPGTYYVRLVNTNTNEWGRSKAFDIVTLPIPIISSVKANTVYGKNFSNVTSAFLVSVDGGATTSIKFSPINDTSLTITLPNNPTLPFGNYNLYLISQVGTSTPFTTKIVSNTATTTSAINYNVASVLESM